MTLSRQPAADMPFDGVQLCVLFRCGEARRVARGTGTRGAPDAMHVILDRVRQIVVDHALNSGHVDAASGDVRRDQDAVTAAAESFQRFAPLRL